jgi:hypothetical protein
MSLDLEKVVGQVAGMAQHLKSRLEDKQAATEAALNLLTAKTLDMDSLKKKIEKARTTWLVGNPRENPSAIYSPVPYPRDHAVLAVDGSNIDVDRHQSTRCFLINSGGIGLEYGGEPQAKLFSQPRLYYRDDEIAILTADNRKIMIEGQVLGIKRTVEELRVLTEETLAIEKDIPIVALLDGTLTLWGIIGLDYIDAVVEEFVTRGFLKYLDKLKDAAEKKFISLASYISFPRSTEAVNMLRLMLCPYDEVNCDQHCGRGAEKRDCDSLNELTDRDIFRRHLKPGERSAVFDSRSSVIRNYYGGQGISFFYLKLENEVARVEIPSWVADRPELLDLTHAVILKQCDSGMGYPVALMEAHEQAVVSGADREQFWRLVQGELERDNMSAAVSAKNWSKRMKWL